MPRFLLPPSAAPTPRPPRDPTTTSLAFVRDLEQFTGCSATSGTMLDFWVGPYREFLSDVRKQAKIGMVVLVCGEHENDEEFKRDILCDPELVRFIKEKEIMVWGADIRSKEGYQGMYNSFPIECSLMDSFTDFTRYHISIPRVRIVHAWRGWRCTKTVGHYCSIRPTIHHNIHIINHAAHHHLHHPTNIRFLSSTPSRAPHPGRIPTPEGRAG